MVAIDTVTSWAQLVTACIHAAPNVSITLSPTFQMGNYTREINFSSKVIIIFGSNATLDAGQKGRFFNGVGSKRNTLLELHDITLNNGKAKQSGGAINAYRADVKIYTSTFNSNSAGDGNANGGAIRINGGGLKIYDTTFKSNTAFNGGAIYAFNDDVNVEIHDSAFESNTAASSADDIGGGGALYASGADVKIYTSIFESNSAGVNRCGTSSSSACASGNICASDSDCISGQYCYFCSTGRDGGAIHIKDGIFVIHDSTFNTNTATSWSGGAIYADGTDVKIYTSIFESNSAEYGGAVYCEQADVKIYTSTFEKNSVVQSGGAIYSINGNISLDSVSVRNSTAGELGGGLFIRSSACEIKNKSCIGNNSAVGAAQIWLSTEQDLGGLTVYNSKIHLSKGSISSQLWLGANYQLSGTSAIICPQGSQLSDTVGEGELTDGKGGELLGCPLCSPNTFNFETEVQNVSRSELASSRSSLPVAAISANPVHMARIALQTWPLAHIRGFGSKGMAVMSCLAIAPKVLAVQVVAVAYTKLVMLHIGIAMCAFVANVWRATVQLWALKTAETPPNAMMHHFFSWEQLWRRLHTLDFSCLR
jgi:predicted outer membrane repeat protein